MMFDGMISYSMQCVMIPRLTMGSTYPSRFAPGFIIGNSLVAQPDPREYSGRKYSCQGIEFKTPASNLTRASERLKDRSLILSKIFSLPNHTIPKRPGRFLTELYLGEKNGCRFGAG
jgi:hypothetical protein